MVSCGGLRLSSGSVLGTALSLAVTTMGAGILTLPSAYADAGIIPATIVLIGVTILTVFSIDFLILGVDKLGRNSYEELTRELLGPKAEEFIRWMLILLNAGAAISYLVVVEDLVTPLQPHVTYYVPWLTTPKHTVLVVWAVIVLPLSCVPTLGALHISSFLAIAATSLICVMIVFRYFVPGPTEPSALTKAAVASGHASANWWWGVHPLLAMPIIMFSFDCQSLVFQIYAGLEDMRRSVMMEVSVISLTITALIHASVGFFGYLSNPVDVRDNIISNYDPNVESLFRVGYVMYAAPIILAFVLLLFPVRDSIFIMWYGFSSASVATHVPRRRDFTRLVEKEEELELLVQAEGANGHKNGCLNGLTPDHSYGTSSSDNSREQPAICKGYITNQHHCGSLDSELHEVVEAKRHHNDVERIPLRDHLLVSVALSTMCVAIALLMPGIVAVVSLLGGICSSTMCFLMPGLYRWQMHYKHIARCNSALEWCVMVFMVGFGVFAGIVRTGVSITTVFAA